MDNGLDNMDDEILDSDGEQGQVESNPGNQGGLLSGRDAYQNTLGNKNYYNDRKDELQKQRDDLKQNHENFDKNLNDAKQKEEQAKKQQEEAKKNKENAKENQDKAGKKEAKKDEKKAKQDAKDAKNNQKQLKKDDRHYKRNLRNNKKDQLANKINQARAKGYKMAHPLEAGKDAAKDFAKEKAKQGAKKVGQAAKEGAKKAGKAAVKGIKAIWKAIPTHWKLIGAGVVLIVFVMLIAVMLIVSAVAGETTSSYQTTAGEYSYSQKLSYLTNEEMDFIINMNSPISGYDLFNLSSTVSSFYGWRGDPVGRSTYRFHNGLDLGYGVTEGSTKVYAVAAGTVTSITSRSSCGGNIVTITHENGFLSRYMHLYSYSVKTGDKVSKGQQIGYVGGSSTSSYDNCTTGAHLHFELENASLQGVNINILAGFSDEQSLECIDDSTVPSDITNCAEKYKSYANNRFNNKLSLKDIVVSKTYTSSTSSSLYEIIEFFEGTTASCTVSGVDGYTAVDIGDGAVTLGAGFTNAEMGNSKITDVINKSGYSSLFSKKGNNYEMKLGSCIPQTLANDMAHIAMDKHMQEIKTKASSVGVTLTDYQISALTSTAYRCPSAIDDILNGYKNYNKKSAVSYKNINPYCNGENGARNKYEGAWCQMSLYFHSSGDDASFQVGVKKRLKTEFAYFVTGDSAEIKKFDSRGSQISNDDYYFNYCSEASVCSKAGQ